MNSETFDTPFEAIRDVLQDGDNAVISGKVLRRENLNPYQIALHLGCNVTHDVFLDRYIFTPGN